MKKPSSTLVGSGYTKSSDTAGLFIIVSTLDGDEYVFDAAYIHLVRYALSTLCVSEMNAEQLDLFTLYIATVNGEIAFSPLTLALDATLVDIALCTDTINAIVCGNSDLHVYAACGTDINL